jgi:hypothetical protein
LGEAGLPFPPTFLVTPTEQAEEFVAFGGWNPVKAEECGDVIVLESAVAGLHSADLAGGHAQGSGYLGAAQAALLA